MSMPFKHFGWKIIGTHLKNLGISFQYINSLNKRNMRRPGELMILPIQARVMALAYIH